MDRLDTNTCVLLALAAMLRGDTDLAERWLLRMTRAERSELKIALDDLEMILNRLGKRQRGR